MSDPDEGAGPSALGGSFDQFEYCANCGAKLPADEWCPSIVDDSDGSPIIRSFCDDACLKAWRTDASGTNDER